MNISPALTPGQQVALRMDTAERTWKELTTPQREALRLAAASPIGVVELMDGRRGLRHSVWERMMGKLQHIGCVKPYVHGGYEITDLGRRALSFQETPNMTTATRYEAHPVKQSGQHCVEYGECGDDRALPVATFPTAL